MTKTIFITFALFILAGLTITACVSPKKPEALAGTQWKLISYGSIHNPTPAVPEANTSLTFSKNGKLNGTVGCNSFSGDYVVGPATGQNQGSRNRITFGPVASTLMACPDPIMDQESVVFQIFSGTTKFTIESDKLTITSSNEETEVTFEQIEK